MGGAKDNRQNLPILRNFVYLYGPNLLATCSMLRNCFVEKFTRLGQSAVPFESRDLSPLVLVPLNPLKCGWWYIHLQAQTK